ncbi:hypothetical protein KAF25_005915 [Fusarium avenaceum]|uniref:NACHT domain-containing protein n=1 Tax=Fusarium avenaceum TaxID=40199 RepID=A0A9P7GVQ3_9HYPO|nr:hypothetical protein KAF25_005915 [Fusarium avenaceum]
MGVREKIKRAFRGDKEGDTLNTPIHARPSAEQQSSLPIDAGPSYLPTSDPSAVPRPVAASDAVNLPQEHPEEAPEKDDQVPQDIEEKDSPIEAFEEQIRLNLPDIASAIRSDANTKDWMSEIIQRQMDEVKRDALKLRFGNFEVEAQEVVKSVLAVVDWSKGYVGKALSSNPTASIAWGGVSLLLPLLLNPSEQAASLAKGLDHISSLIVRSSMWEDLYVRRYESITCDTLTESHAEYRHALEMLYQEVLRFQIVCYRYYSHKSASRLALDAVKHHGWEELLENIKYRETEFDKVSNGWRDKMYNEEWEKEEARHQQAMGQWRSIGTDVSELRKEVEKVQKDKKRQEMLDWLCAVDTSVQYRAARGKYSRGTCAWLVQESDRFKAWERNPKSFLWLNGKAGSGKSILSSSVIKYFKDRYEQDPETALAYFFFSFGSLEQQKVSVMLSSLVRQLCASRPDTPPPIKRFDDYMARGERPDIESLEAALLAAVSGFSSVFIIVDALDECPAFDGERSRLLDCLERIIIAMPDNLHIFCTSRAEPDIHMTIEELLSPPAKAAIDLTQNQTGLNSDLRLHVDTVLGTKTYNSWSDDVKAKAKDILITRADGMFQYLVCQFEVLRYLDSEASVLSALSDLPKGLDETYNSMLLGLNPNFQAQILGSLKWLALSRRPLRLDEFAKVFIFRPEIHTKIKKAQRLFKAETVVKHFSSLVNTETKSEWNDNIQACEIVTHVRLAHFTVKEYLISKRIEQSSSRISRFLIEEDINLALREAAEEGHVEIVQFLLAEHVNTDKIGSGALQVAANRGHLSVMKVLLDNGADIDAHDDRFGSALEAAAKGINLTALRQLLEYGADVRKAGCPVSCLIAACKVDDQNQVTECIHVLKLLLDKGANINRKCTGHRSALNEAIRTWLRYGTREFFDFIIRHGADIDLDDGQDGSPLQAACGGVSNLERILLGGSRCKAVVEALLRLGTDPNAQGGECGNALQKACYVTLHHFGVVELLLDEGAEINQQGGRYRTALHAACANPSLDLVGVLLSRGADVHIQGGECGSVLQAATMFHKFGNTVHVVQRLLESGADVNATGGKFGSALQAAVYSGCSSKNAITVERLLLNEGAEVNVQGGIYGTALQSACVRGSMASVRLLLSYGAEVNAEGGRYGTALQAACANDHWKQHYDLARLLIDHGADIHLQGGPYGSAWHAAAAIRHWNKQGLDTLKLLLDKGANVNDCRGRYGTALQVALEHMTVGIQDRIHFLLENGANVNLGAGIHGFPLQSACLAPTDNTVNPNHRGLVYLLENCADIDVNKTGGLFGTALQAAAYEGKTRGLRLLIEKGANVNIRGGKYGSALNAAVVKGCWDLVNILLDSGAEADCHLFPTPDEEWLENVCKEDGHIAVKRYRNFWEKVKLY